MKKIICALMFCSLNVHANTGSIRAFVVEWSGNAYDQEVQMCDDNYYSKLEIYVPSYPRINQQNLLNELDRCELELVEKSWVTMSGKNYLRFQVEGSWDCELTIEKSMTEYSSEKSKFTISLVDGC